MRVAVYHSQLYINTIATCIPCYICMFFEIEKRATKETNSCNLCVLCQADYHDVRAHQYQLRSSCGMSSNSHFLLWLQNLGLLPLLTKKEKTNYRFYKHKLCRRKTVDSYLVLWLVARDVGSKRRC